MNVTYGEKKSLINLNYNNAKVGIISHKDRFEKAKHDPHNPSSTWHSWERGIENEITSSLH